MMDSKALTEAWPSKTASMTGEESQQGSPEQPSGTPWALVVREAELVFNVIRRDISSAVIPGLIFCVAAWNSSGQPLGALGPSLARSLLYFLLYSFTFCLSNQIVGVEEDRINKPDRPLARGVVSIQGAWKRWFLAMGVYTFVGWWLGVLEWALLWQAVTVVHNVMRGARNWFIKNLSMGLGVLAALEAGWRMGAPMTENAWQWIVFLSVSVFVLVPLQDLRDIEGDRGNQRNTFPMAIGMTATRVFLGIGFAALAVITHVLLMQLAGTTGWVVWACDAALGGVSLLIAWRVLALRTPQADHTTYMLYTYWYCIALASAIVVL